MTCVTRKRQRWCVCEQLRPLLPPASLPTAKNSGTWSSELRKHSSACRLWNTLLDLPVALELSSQRSSFASVSGMILCAVGQQTPKIVVAFSTTAPDLRQQIRWCSSHFAASKPPACYIPVVNHKLTGEPSESNQS